VESCRHPGIGPTSIIQDPLHQSFIGSKIQSALVSKVQNNEIWSLIADETSDISHHEQLSLCFRTVSKELVVEEHFFKYIAVPSTDAASLVAAIKEQVFDAGFPIEGQYFQCYDGARASVNWRTGVLYARKFGQNAEN